MNNLADKEIKSVNEDTYTFDSDSTKLIQQAIAKKKKKGVRAARRKSGTFKWIIAGSCTALVLLLGYFGGWAASMGKFLPNTYINDVNVGKMTAKEASDAIQSSGNADNLVITEKSGSSKQIPLKDFDYVCDIFSAVKELYNSQNHAGWIGTMFKETNYTIDTEAIFNSDKLDRIIRGNVWGSIKTSDAKFVHGDSGYYVEPEVYGDTADIDKLAKYVVEQVDEGNLNINLDDSDCYTKPKVFSTDLEPKVDEMNAKFNFTITYDFDYAQETLTGADVYEMMNDDGTPDRSKVEAYVEKLAQKYDTFMTPRKFKTTNRGEITVSQDRYSTGQYGWWIDTEKTTDKLLEYINDAQNVTIDPVYVTLDTGYCYEGLEADRSASGDIGDTYIEVDLTAQHLWYYQKGELKFETDQIVSGKATDPKKKTPGGVYGVYTKSTNYTMKAADGSYTAKCSYFMRISFEGIGFHDLSRSVYGGNTYINNGSHGCINMRYSEVKQLYDMVERGTPAILYY